MSVSILRNNDCLFVTMTDSVPDSFKIWIICDTIHENRDTVEPQVINWTIICKWNPKTNIKSRLFLHLFPERIGCSQPTFHLYRTFACYENQIYSSNVLGINAIELILYKSPFSAIVICGQQLKLFTGYVCRIWILPFLRRLSPWDYSLN